MCVCYSSTCTCICFLMSVLSFVSPASVCECLRCADAHCLVCKYQRVSVFIDVCCLRLHEMCTYVHTNGRLSACWLTCLCAYLRGCEPQEYVGVNPKKVRENMQVPAVESGGIVSQPGPRDALLQSFLFHSIPPPFQTPIIPYHFLGGFLTENLTLL